MAAVLFATNAFATTTPTNIPNTQRDYSATDAARDLLVRADEVLNALTYTIYVLSGELMDYDDGVYQVDCTGYLNSLVEDVAPVAYDDLLERRDTNRPRADDYYYLFRSIAAGATRGGWTRVSRVVDLRPGDILVWKYDNPGATTGHAMVVVSKPVRDTRWSNAYKVRVSDSARSGHGTDNRGATGSGVGAGYILLRAGSQTGSPYQYAWNLNGVFHADVSFAMGRLAD